MSRGPQPSELELQIQQKLLAELSAAERRYRHLVERLQDVVIECDRNGRIRYLNQAWERALGYPVKACLGCPLEDFLYGDDTARHIDLSGEEAHSEIRLRHRDGHPVWFELTLTRAGGTRVGLLYHIDRRKETERALEQARDAALEAARLRSEFLANMSHEIRTPLHGLMGMLDLMLAGDLPETLRDYARTARDSARHLLTLLNDILDLSRLEAGAMPLEEAPVDVVAVVRSCVALMAAKAREKGLRLHLDLEPALPATILGDEARLRQVLFNLLSNAVKFTERGSVTVGVAHTGGELLLWVRDTGIGIPRERLEAVFDAFTQGDGSITRRYGGSGLGLAISRRLTEAMGGRLQVISTPGRGSIFTVRLPLKVAAALPPVRGTQPARGERDAPRREIDGARVLVVEDNPVNRKLAQAMLAKLGCWVDLAVDGEQGVAQAARQLYDLIIMDCQMPVMDGFEATRRIRAGGPNAKTPIVAVTANAMPEDESRCLAVMDDYLSKPLGLDRLAECLQRWLRRRDA